MACKHPLELPSVHFLCQHSYHEHCFQSFSDAENECPACQPDNRKIVEIVRSQDRSRDRHDEFHHQLDRAEDSFAVVAEYFGRGLFRDNSHLEQQQHQGKQEVTLEAEQPKKQPQRRSPVPAEPLRGSSAEKNPFSEDMSPEHKPQKSTNPFGSPEKSPPDGNAPSNPFGEEEDYDESLNPFGE